MPRIRLSLDFFSSLSLMHVHIHTMPLHTNTCTHDASMQAHHAGNHLLLADIPGDT